MLRRLEGIGLHALSQCSPHAQLTGRGQAHINVTVRGVLDVFLQVELHQRIPTGGADAVFGGNGHRDFGRSLALLLFLGGLGQRLLAEQRTPCTGHHRRGETELAGRT